MSEHLLQLLAHPFGRHLGQLGGVCLDRGQRYRLDRKAQPGRETHRSQKPQMILSEARRRLADGSDKTRLQVCSPADVIDHPHVQRIEEHPVDREVAPLGVVLGVRRRHPARSATVQIRPISAESGHLYPAPPHLHQHHPELHPHLARSPKQLAYPLGRGSGRHVIVQRLMAQQ